LAPPFFTHHLRTLYAMAKKKKTAKKKPASKIEAPKDIYIVVQRPHGECDILIFTEGSPEFFAMIDSLEESNYGFQVTTMMMRCLGLGDELRIIARQLEARPEGDQ